MRYEWDKKSIELACEILGKYEKVKDALPEIGRTLNTPVTRDGLVAAFMRNGKAASEYTKRIPYSYHDHKEQRLRDMVKKAGTGPLSIEVVSNELDISPSRVNKLIESLRADGVAINVHNNFVGHKPADNSTGEKRISVSEPVGKPVRIAVISDVHIGHKSFQKDYFLDFFTRAYEAGVRTFLCPGDLLDGTYRHSIWDQRYVGYEEQSTYASMIIPHYKDVKIHWCLGNHEETMERESGINIGLAMVDKFRRLGREDLVYHGHRGSFFRLCSPGAKHGLRVEMWHPKQGGAYALSYKMQKHIEGYAPGQKPDVLLVGHWHQSCYFVQRGIHAMSCGTFHGHGDSFSKSLGGTQAIGGWLIDYQLATNGTVRAFSPTWVAYYEHEVERKVTV